MDTCPKERNETGLPLVNYVDSIYSDTLFSYTVEQSKIIENITTADIVVTSSSFYTPSLPGISISKITDVPVQISGVSSISRNLDEYFDGLMTSQQYFELCDLADEIFIGETIEDVVSK